MDKDKDDIKNMIELATELRDLDVNKFAEVRGIMRGVLLASSKKNVKNKSA